MHVQPALQLRRECRLGFAGNPSCPVEPHGKTLLEDYPCAPGIVNSVRRRGCPSAWTCRSSSTTAPWEIVVVAPACRERGHSCASPADRDCDNAGGDQDAGAEPRPAERFVEETGTEDRADYDARLAHRHDIGDGREPRGGQHDQVSAERARPAD